jgi:hypothetical protein
VFHKKQPSLEKRGGKETLAIKDVHDVYALRQDRLSCPDLLEKDRHLTGHRQRVDLMLMVTALRNRVAPSWVNANLPESPKFSFPAL